MWDRIKDKIPFQLKRGTSVLSVIVAIIILGALERLGALLFDLFWQVTSPHFPKLFTFIYNILTYKFEVNVVTVILFTLLIFPTYNFIDKTFLKIFRTQTILRDRRFHGWLLNYWGTNNALKTNRIENNLMIFEATPDELMNKDNQYGAFLDLRNGVYQGNRYEISCQLKSENNCSMKFQLWVHDTIGGPGKSVIVPQVPTTPSETWQTVTLTYIAEVTNALRIHLHVYGGLGRIIVREVKVRKIE